MQRWKLPTEETDLVLVDLVYYMITGHNCFTDWFMEGPSDITVQNFHYRWLLLLLLPHLLLQMQFLAKKWYIEKFIYLINPELDWQALNYNVYRSIVS